MGIFEGANRAVGDSAPGGLGQAAVGQQLQRTAVEIVGEKAAALVFQLDKLALLSAQFAIVAGHQRLKRLRPVCAAGIEMQQVQGMF